MMDISFVECQLSLPCKVCLSAINSSGADKLQNLIKIFHCHGFILSIRLDMILT